jgi:hypothetical protein
MICGRPSVVTDVGGNLEWINEPSTGFVADSPSARSLRNAVERAWEARAHWEQVGQRAHQLARSKIDPHPEEAVFSLLIEAAGPVNAWHAHVSEPVPTRPRAAVDGCTRHQLIDDAFTSSVIFAPGFSVAVHSKATMSTPMQPSTLDRYGSLQNIFCCPKTKSSLRLVGIEELLSCVSDAERVRIPEGTIGAFLSAAISRAYPLTERIADFLEQDSLEIRPLSPGTAGTMSHL